MATERKAAARVGAVGLMEGQWSFQLHDGTDDPIGFIAFFFDEKAQALRVAEAMRAIVAVPVKSPLRAMTGGTG